jgi:hypothetical protein
MLPEPNRRISWINQEQATRSNSVLLIHLAVMVRFGLETGLRRASATGLVAS